MIWGQIFSPPSFSEPTHPPLIATTFDSRHAMVCDYSPCSQINTEKTISGSMFRLQKILTDQIPNWDCGQGTEFTEMELAERPPTPIDWESNILEGLDVLAVPQWTDQVKVTSSICMKDHEKKFHHDLKAAEESIADLLNVHLDGEDIVHQRPFTRHQSRMLHQIQSDLLVKEELVSHIVRSQAEFTAMKNEYEEKLRTLQNQVSEVQPERRLSAQSPERHDRRLSMNQQPRVTTMMPVSSTNHEVEIKKLTGEIDELQKKYNQCLSATQIANVKNEKQFRKYELMIEYMKLEKKGFQNYVKEQDEKIKHREEDYRTEMARIQLERDHLLENQAKLSKDLQAAKSVLKKKSEEAMQATCQLKQMIPILDRAFKNGFVFDEIPDSIKSKLTHQTSNFIITRDSKSDESVETRAVRKKNNLKRMIQQYVEADQRALKYKQLLIKRNMVFMERSLLISEVESSLSNACGQIAEAKFVELNIQIEELTKALKQIHHSIEDQQKQLNDRITGQEFPVSGESKGRTSAQQVLDFDMLLNRKGAYDSAMSIVRSVNAKEGKLLSETLLKEVLVLKCRELSRDMGTLQMDYTIRNLRKVLHSMKSTSADDEDATESFHKSDDSERMQYGVTDTLEILPEMFGITIQINGASGEKEVASTTLPGTANTQSNASLDLVDLDLKMRERSKRESGNSSFACTNGSSASDNLESDNTPPPLIRNRSSLKSFLSDNSDKGTRTMMPIPSSSSLRHLNYSTIHGRDRWTLQTTYCTSESISSKSQSSAIFNRLASRHTLASHAKINARMYSPHTGLNDPN